MGGGGGGGRVGQGLELLASHSPTAPCPLFPHLLVDCKITFPLPPYKHFVMFSFINNFLTPKNTIIDSSENQMFTNMDLERIREGGGGVQNGVKWVACEQGQVRAQSRAM